MVVDYSNWKTVEDSEDSDDTHPNVDTPSLFRWRHEGRLQRMVHDEAEKKEFQTMKKKFMKEKKILEVQKLKGENVTILENDLQKTENKLKIQEAKLVKKEKITPWNVDTMSHDGFSKTIINTKPATQDGDLTDEQLAKKFQKFIEANEKLVTEFGLLRKFDDSRRFLLEHTELICENTANYLTMWCVNLAQENKFELMKHVSHQCAAMNFLLQLAKQVDRDPRSCASDFYSKIAHAEENEYQRAFHEEIENFRKRILESAEKRNKKGMEEQREKRLGPGGLDPLEVFESLPEELKSCFEHKDILQLQKALVKMPTEQAQHYLQQCIGSGLWVPDAQPPHPVPVELISKYPYRNLRNISLAVTLIVLFISISMYYII